MEEKICVTCKECNHWFPKKVLRNGILKLFCTETCRKLYWERKNRPTVKMRQKMLEKQASQDPQALAEAYY